MIRRWGLLVVVILCFALDVIVKYWVVHVSFPSQGNHFLYPYGGIGVFENIWGVDCCINRVYNTGSAWGLFSAYPQALLIVRGCIITVLGLYTLLSKTPIVTRIALSFVCVGAIGNVVDYFVYGAVVDMFHFVFWGYSYPVFNVADVFIVLGVIVLGLGSVIHRYQKRLAVCK